MYWKRFWQKKKSHAAYYGELGELYARRYLRKQKYRIITHNWKHKSHEIDIVALDRDVLVFVEVKTRQCDAIKSGYYEVDKQKKQALLIAIAVYKKRLKKKPNHVRFDIIEIQMKPDSTCNLFHYQNADLR
ncbi:MAG: hypothetical protein A2007_01210 [Verrucomicrobia bacterium GWC2_42_7]|nr:MAG: hypothetical protein A2007_01210 [Verrucomicrobia bacterium GWC2_42_7]